MKFIQISASCTLALFGILLAIAPAVARMDTRILGEYGERNPAGGNHPTSFVPEPEEGDTHCTNRSQCPGGGAKFH